jgi:hypothetical protein
MITARTSRCQICGKEIVTKGNWFNQIYIRPLNDLKFELHSRKEHKKRFLRYTILFLCLMEIALGSVLQVIMLILWILTLPFWTVHEFCTWS